jgi:predicted Zn-ribbon and HTH transcriptional regulator
MKRQLTCKRCQFKWKSSIDPRACPKCKSYEWKNPRKRETAEKGEKKHAVA